VTIRSCTVSETEKQLRIVRNNRQFYTEERLYPVYFISIAKVRSTRYSLCQRTKEKKKAKR
jgi:hypothetical protein